MCEMLAQCRVVSAHLLDDIAQVPSDIHPGAFVVATDASRSSLLPQPRGQFVEQKIQLLLETISPPDIVEQLCFCELLLQVSDPELIVTYGMSV